jgi:hypothetical protein
MKVSQEMIDFKLKQVSEFEAKWGVSTRTLAIRKWCTDAQYRKREEAFRKSVASSINNSNKDYRYGKTI